MASFFRSASVLALLATALAAKAQVSYTFASPISDFTLITNTYVTSQTTFAKSALAASTSNVLSVTLFPVAPNTYPGSGIDVYAFNGNNDQYDDYYFAPGVLSQNGVYPAQNGATATTLTVSGSPTPEPSALVALGFGAVAVLRRRKRA